MKVSSYLGHQNTQITQKKCNITFTEHGKKSDLTVQFGPFSVLIIQKHLSSSVYYFANSFEIFLRGVNSKGCWKDDSTGPVAHLFSCI